MAYDPILLFKLLMLKSKYELSDRDLMDHARTDMAIKFFLDLAPEDDVPHHTTLTKFRKLRLQDESFMSLLISKTVEVAIFTCNLKRIIILEKKKWITNRSYP